ncbi:hypothetical protein [Nodularia sp. UHCC 0506]|uniref:hypothetical protein n=1 Tax=Nodularia sp. UHCC 0506 TaxID=3110243 RepID=UPI002B1F8E0D|nr:hypothetical protein [Nodularia sp. UHCC 0506]MEA5516787.1 hypothetical protein [Nodularia sp. UHCC 0506]
MKSHRAIIIVVIACLISSCDSNKKELGEAVKALQQVDSATSVGTNISNYATQLTSAKTEVDAYLLKDSNSERAKKIDKLLNRHLAALSWWQCNLSQAESSLKDEYEVASECRDAVLPKIFELFPGIKQDAEQAITNKPRKYKSESLDKSAVLQFMWEETSIDTKSLLEDANGLK